MSYEIVWVISILKICLFPNMPTGKIFHKEHLLKVNLYIQKSKYQKKKYPDLFPSNELFQQAVNLELNIISNSNILPLYLALVLELHTVYSSDDIFARRQAKS